MPARSGPVTKDTSTVALGLAKILVGDSAGNIDNIDQVLSDDASLGALNSSSFTSTVEYWKLLSGFPQMEDKTIPLSEVAQLDCEFKEITPKNLAYARGIDASGEYPDAHSGEIPLGTISEPAYVRAEAVYTYPNQTNHMYVIFPRAQITSSLSLDFSATDNANVSLTVESKNADASVSGGSASWTGKSLGRIFFD